MRLIRLKFNTDREKQLRALARSVRLREASLVEDVAALIYMKGALPTKDAVQKAVPRYAKAFGTTETFARIVLLKRLQVLGVIAQSPVFGYFTQRPKADLVQSTERLLNYLWSVQEAQQRSQCGTCPLFSQCEFGKLYGAHVTDIRTVFDPSWEDKVHAECPERPAFSVLDRMHRGALMKPTDLLTSAAADPSAYDPNNAMFAAYQQAAADELTWRRIGSRELADEDLGDPDLLREESYAQRVAIVIGGHGGCSKTEDEYGTQHTAIQSVPEDVVQKLSAAELHIFNLGMVLAGALKRAGKVRLGNDAGEGADKRERRFRTERDLTHVQPTENGLPTEVFDARMARKTLRVDERRDNKRAAPQAIAVVEDVSGSMCMQQCLLNKRLISRTAMARAISLALAQRLASERGAMYYGYFATRLSKITRCLTEAELRTLVWTIRSLGNVGGGTSIANALNCTLDVLAKDQRDGIVTPRELLLITDGEDSVTNTPQFMEHFSKRLRELRVELDYIYLSDLDAEAIAKQRKSPKPKLGLEALATRTYICPNGDLDINALIGVLK